MTKYHVEGVLELTRFRRGNTGGASGTVDVQVGASLDDGWSSTTPAFDNTGDNAAAGNFAGILYNTFARWTNVTIPQGAMIDVAYFEWVAWDAGGDGVGTETNIYMEDSDDAVAPTSRAEHEADARTTAFVAWDDFDSTDTSSFNQSPSIASVVQEVVDRGSWVSGNAMMLLWDDDGSNGGNRYTQTMYDGDTVEAFKLHVEWST